MTRNFVEGRAADELQGIEVRIAENESDAHGLSGKGADIAAALPGDGAVECVSKKERAVFEREAWPRRAVRVLKLDANVASGARCEVQRQLVAGEGQRLRKGARKNDFVFCSPDFQSG